MLSYRVLSLAERTVLPRLVFLWAWAASLRPGRGRTRREVRRRSRTVRARGRSGAPPRGTTGYAAARCVIRLPRSGPRPVRVFWCQTISNHAESSARNHTTSKRLRGRGRAPRTILAGGGSQVAHVVPASRMRGEFRCVLGCCSDGRHAPATFGRHAPSRVRAAAAVAAANSGPIVTPGLQSGVKSGEEMHRSTSSQAQKIGRWTAPPVFSHILPFNGLCLYGSCRPHLRP